MITTLISDFSRVLLFPKDKHYAGGLNALHKQRIEEDGEEYPFFKYFTFNEELFNIYKNVSAKCPIYIFTTDTIQERKEIREMLDRVVVDVFSAKNHNLKKNEAESYLFIAHKLQKLPQTFLYIDDLEENVEAAKKAGMNAIQYESNENIIEKLKELTIY